MQPKTIFILELELESVLPDLATSSEFGYFKEKSEPEPKLSQT